MNAYIIYFIMILIFLFVILLISKAINRGIEAKSKVKSKKNIFHKKKPNMVNEIKRLKQLRKNKILSKIEFKKAKNKLLNE